MILFTTMILNLLGVYGHTNERKVEMCRYAIKLALIWLIANAAAVILITAVVYMLRAS